MPISIGVKDRPYKNNVLSYKAGECLYLVTDGFASQFGGIFDKKIKSSGLKKLMLEYSQLPIREQKDAFALYFEEWKAGGEQTDDVLLMGLRL